MTPESGLLLQRFPYVRFGTGAEPLVVLPGLTLDNHVPGRTVTRSYAWAMRGLATGRTVTVLHRPQGLVSQAPAAAPRETGSDLPVLDTPDIADAYAAALRDEPGPVDVLALSTGGLVGQHLALRHPGLVRRMALAVTGARIDGPGRRMCERWLDLAREQAWRSLRGDLAAAAVDGAATQWLARRVGSSGGPPDAADAADFVATTAAVLRHDTAALLGGLRAPVLVVGGRDDPFFPEAVLRETAAAIPDATVAVHAGGHGVPKQHARWLQERVRRFLDGGPPPGS